MELQVKLINEQSKKEIQASGLASAEKLLNDGWLKPEETLTTAKKVIEYCNSLIKGLESSVRAEVDKNGGLELNGVKLSLSSIGTRLAYEDDSVYKELKAKLKSREELLKTVHKSGVEIADAATGEIIPIVSIKSPSRETLIVKF